MERSASPARRRGPDLTGLLTAFDAHGVAYVVTGSVAALAHGAEDIEPGDLDIVPATDEGNLRALAIVLEELDAGAEPVTGAWRREEDGGYRWDEDGVERIAGPLDPSDPASFDHAYRTRLGTLDVVPHIAGRYRDLKSRAGWLDVAGRTAWVAHPVDLLAGITVSRRATDRARVAHLRRVAAAHADKER